VTLIKLEGKGHSLECDHHHAFKKHNKGYFRVKRPVIAHLLTLLDSPMNKAEWFLQR
jgi:rRNA pseudouridine-1189 N-methylase Emg1 (Nep1/Mra1 family)